MLMNDPAYFFKVSKFSVTRSRYCLISFLKSEIVVVNIIVFILYASKYKYMYK